MPCCCSSPELSGERHVVVYANPRALSNDSGIRIGARLPHDVGEIAFDAIQELRHSSPVRRVVVRDIVSRRVSVEATFTAVGDGQVMISARELTSEEAARAELERSDRVLRAIGAGAFGTIAVYEPRFVDAELVELHLLWSANGHGHGGGQLPPLDPTSVLSASDLLQMAQVMLAAGELKRSGWVPIATVDGHERSVEFTLVLAGDRFVLEFVERTEELTAAHGARHGHRHVRRTAIVPVAGQSRAAVAPQRHSRIHPAAVPAASARPGRRTRRATSTPASGGWCRSSTTCCCSASSTRACCGSTTQAVDIGDLAADRGRGVR